MVEFISFPSKDCIYEIKKRCPPKMIKYIVNNTAKKSLYFFYGDDAKYYKIKTPEVYIIRKMEVDVTGKLPLIEILDTLAMFLSKNVVIVLYTNDTTIDIAPGIIKFPCYSLPKVITNY